MTPRQKRLFQDTCDVWRQNVPSAGTADTFTKVGTAVKYHHEWSPSKSNPTPAGRMEGDILQTQDILHFLASEDVDQGYIVVNKTVDRFGNNAPTYGSGWRVEGDPRSNVARGARNVNQRSVLAVKMPDLPSGVS